MNFIGIWSQTGFFYKEWSIGFIILSIFLSFTIVYAGLKLLYDTKFVPSVVNQFIAASIIAGAVCCMHYTGMKAVSYKFNKNTLNKTGYSLYMIDLGSTYRITIMAGILKFVLLLFVQMYDRELAESAMCVTEILLLRAYKYMNKQNTNKLNRTLSLLDIVEKGMDIEGWLYLFREKRELLGWQNPTVFNRSRRETSNTNFQAIFELLEQNLVPLSNIDDSQLNTKSDLKLNTNTMNIDTKEYEVFSPSNSFKRYSMDCTLNIPKTIAWEP